MQYQPAFHQPFPQQSHGFMPLAAVAAHKDVSRKIVSGRKWFIAKIALELLSIVFGLVVTGLSAGLLAVQISHTTDSWYINAQMGFPPGILAILWPAAEIITLAVRRNRGIHPGAHVGMHLVIWLTGTAAGGLIAADYALDAEFTYWWLDDYGPASDRQTAGYALYLSIELALTICLWPLVVVNMILFVRACIECHRRNMNRALHRVNKKAQLMAAQSAWTPAAVNQYQQYPMMELEKNGTPKPQVAAVNSIPPVQTPSHQPFHPATAELTSTQTPHAQTHVIHEIGSAQGYPKTVAASDRVEMPTTSQHIEMPASTPQMQVASPMQEHIGTGFAAQHVELPAQQQQGDGAHLAQFHHAEGDDESIRGQRSGPPQYVMIGGTKVRYHEF